MVGDIKDFQKFAGRIREEVRIDREVVSWHLAYFI